MTAMSLSYVRRVEPFVVVFFALVTISVLLLTSDEVELGRIASLLSLVFLVLGVLSISLERVMYG